MNSWNLSQAPAYNLKVYNVIDNKLQNKVFELMDTENFYDDINLLIADFDRENGYLWQAGFNGRSGGYLVLYKGGKREDNSTFTYPGKAIEDNEVPVEVLKKFRQLAIDIIKTVEYMAKNYNIKEEDYTVTKTRKVLIEA
jgi:hypothetical protein